MNTLVAQSACDPANTTIPPIPYGYCRCGCEQKCSIAKYTINRLGQKKGEPKHYIHGHNTVKPRLQNRIVIVGGKRYRTMPTTRGMEAIVNISEYRRVARHRWHIETSGKDKDHLILYACTYIDGKKVSMHNFILRVPDGEEVDHRNGNGLDNRRCNLRPSTHAQNSAGQRRHRDGSSQYKGVSLGPWKTWISQLHHGHKQYYLGNYREEKKAALAYDAKARELFGKYGRFNFPRVGETGLDGTIRRRKR
jgi:hypothetical protein